MPSFSDWSSLLPVLLFIPPGWPALTDSPSNSADDGEVMVGILQNHKS
jgi:hypothetical protein